MIATLVGIAPTIYIFKFLIRIRQFGAAHKSMVAVAMGPKRHASVAMRRKSGGSGRAVRSFT